MIERDPSVLLQAAHDLEPGLRLSERAEVLDRLAALLEAGEAVPAPAGRDWALELAAERAVDLARLVELQQARVLAESVLAAAGPELPLARARATEALGRTLAWSGTDGTTRNAERVLRDAIAQYAVLGIADWQGHSLFWLGNSVFFQNGNLDDAEQCMRQALDVLGAGSPRRPTVLSFLADVLIARGDWPAAEAVLIEGESLAVTDPMSRAYIAWAWARMMSPRGDARATERYLRETERDAADWFYTNTGITFLADAAELLDRVGQRSSAEAYLARALERDPDDEFVRQARALLLARGGDPDEALDALQELTRGTWLEKRLVWRHTLFAAYATLRSGRPGAGDLAALALKQAAATGGVEVATSAEPELVEALLPSAEAAGSSHARDLLAPAGNLIVRLFGGTRVSGPDGELVLPAGQPAELFRMLAVHYPQPVTVEQIVDWFFGELDLDSGRHRLRQVLTRLRAGVGDAVIREGNLLRLAPAWVDLRAFRTLSDRALAARGPVAVERAYSALALWNGQPLPIDPYAGWASAPRDQLRHRYLSLLDLVSAEAASRGSVDESLRALALAREEDPYDESRYVRAAELLVGLGRRGAAVQLARQAAVRLAEIAVPLPAALKALLAG